jgi:HK97 gp10 family phage protein
MAYRVEGLDEVLIKINKLADPEKVAAAMGKACALVERSAKQKAHSFRDTGTLTNSITSKVNVEDTTVKGVIYTPLEYAPYVEYGTGLFAEEGGRRTPWKYKDDEGHWHTTRGQKPHPYLRPALNENRNKIIEVLKEGIRQ